jgi:transposase-like protein
MDTCAEAVATDALGRRTGPRQRHTIEQKGRIVEETHVRGASVATVARCYQVNANQVFAWRQLYRGEGRRRSGPDAAGEGDDADRIAHRASPGAPTAKYSATLSTRMH